MASGGSPLSIWLAAPLLALLAYLTTLGPTITSRHWGIDTGEMALAAYGLTVPHPSGYPTYLLIGYLSSLAPIGSIAYRLNIMSAVFGALTVGLVAYGIVSARVAD